MGLQADPWAPLLGGTAPTWLNVLRSQVHVQTLWPKAINSGVCFTLIACIDMPIDQDDDTMFGEYIFVPEKGPLWD